MPGSVAPAGTASGGGVANCRTSLKALVKTLCVKHHIPDSTYASDAKLCDAVVEKWARRYDRGERGDVDCGQVWRGMKKDDIPAAPGSVPVYVSKGKGRVGTALSPFVVPFPRARYEPYGLTKAGGEEAGALLPPRPLELVWQSAKIKRGETMQDFYKRREQIFSKGVVKRRYVKKADTIVGAVFAGVPYPYVASRVFYCEPYIEAVKTTAEFKFLDELCGLGVSLLLLGPDGFPLGGSLSAAKAAYQSVSAPYGHERVLVSMLRGYSLNQLFPANPTDPPTSAHDEETGVNQ